MNLSEYTWPRPPGFTPFEHQKTTAEFLIERAGHDVTLNRRVRVETPNGIKQLLNG